MALGHEASWGPSAAEPPGILKPGGCPNAIWSLGYQHRALALGCRGDPNARTPDIDNLGSMGVHFTQACSVQPLHGPYVAPPECRRDWSPGTVTFRPIVPPVAPVRDSGASELAGYYAMAPNLDHNLGRVIDTLRQEGLAFNTYTLFFSGHGDMLGPHGMYRMVNLARNPALKAEREKLPALLRQWVADTGGKFAVPEDRPKKPPIAAHRRFPRGRVVR